MFYFFLLILLFLSEHIGAVILIILGIWLIGVIVENIEIACIVIGIISAIISSFCYSYITDYRFDKGIIGVIIAITVHIFFFLTLEFSGGLFFTYLIIGLCALIAISAYDDSDILSMLIVLASIIIPAIITINSLI